MRAVLVLCLATGTAAAAPRAVWLDEPVDAVDPVAAARRVAGDRRLALVAYRRSLTGEHVRFAPLASDGTPIAGAAVSVHLGGAAPRYRARLLWDDGEAQGALVGRREITTTAAARAAASAAGGVAGPPEPVALAAGPGVLVPGWRVYVDAPGRLWEVWVDGRGGARVVRDVLQRASVYRPNPVVVTGDTALVDNDNADTPELTAALESVTLPFLDGSGMLRGPYADVSNPTARVTDGQFDFTRSMEGFEEVNAYFHVTRVQEELQSLGFTGPKAILNRAQRVIVNATPNDESNFNIVDKVLRFGAGGADDAEDGDIVAHEYGHAMMDFIVPGYGGTESSQAEALGEGYCDFQALVLPTGSTVLYDRNCFAAWDARSYLGGPTTCYRRTDRKKHLPESRRFEQYADSEIWSGALFEMIRQTGLSPELGYQLVVESMYHYNPREEFAQAARALLEADLQLHGGAHSGAIRRVMTWYGIMNDITPPAATTGVLRTVTFALPVGPLANDVDEDFTITEPGAPAVRVHFASVDMAVGIETEETCPRTECDGVYLYDGDGNLYARIGGARQDYDGPAIPGDTVVVRWVTDGQGPSAGFTVDRLDVLAIAPDAGPVDAGPGGAGGGCACHTAGGSGGAVPWLMAIALRWFWRRRRPRS